MIKKRRRNVQTSDENEKPVLEPMFWRWKRRQRQFIQALLTCIHSPRLRQIWMHPNFLAWFDMVETSFDDKQWYANFRISRGTFAYLLNKISDDTSRQDTPMRQAVTPTRRLALTLYYLASTLEYRTIGNLFGVSVSFVCCCVKDVC